MYNHHHPVFPGVQRLPDTVLLIPSRIALTPSRTICSLLHHQSNPLHTLFNLSLLCLLWLTSLLLSIFFKHHCLLQNALIIPSFTCSYHLTPFAFAVLSNVSFKLIGFINFILFFLSTNFTPHVDLTIALSVLLKITISFSLKHCVSLHRPDG